MSKDQQKTIHIGETKPFYDQKLALAGCKKEQIPDGIRAVTAAHVATDTIPAGKVGVYYNKLDALDKASLLATETNLIQPVFSR